MLELLRRSLKLSGLRGTAALIRQRLQHPRIPEFTTFEEELRAGRGLEIGGPSPFFARGRAFPVYEVADVLDNCDYSAVTVWNERECDGTAFRAPRWGRTLVCEATRLAAAADGGYDYVICSHVLEHVANPLAALREWSRVLRARGLLVLVVPHRDGTFDRWRPVTALAHLQEDARRGTGEDDLTHLPEILRLHDLGRDPGCPSREELERRGRDNLRTRCLHHHVFDTQLVVALVDAAPLRVLAARAWLPNSVLCVARKPVAGERIDNSWPLSPDAAWRRESPFTSDHP